MPVDKQYVQDQLDNLDSKRRRGVGKELKHLHEVSNEGENILGHTRGFYDGNTWLICVTDSQQNPNRMVGSLMMGQRKRGAMRPT